ncbi:MAG: hypothetical protein D3904_05790, partial [Candidatus Electrothrix sp. EH2]|nr:hypothetical protein [Candidatus Electrothrix sp. EH2]
TPEELRVILFFANPFAHPTVMMNRSLFIKHHLEYDTNFAVAQDYDLWERASRKMKLLKLPDVLLQYRMHPKNVTSRHKDIVLPLLYQVYSRMLQHIGLNATEDDLKLHHQIASRNRLASFEEILKAENWLLNIQDKAFTAQVYDNEALMRVLGYFWFELTRNCGNLGIASFMKYRTSRLRRWYFPGIQDLTTYFLSCLWYQLLSQYKKNNKIPWHRPN